MKCAECGVEMSPRDMGERVRTDAGPVHRECFEGPVPVGGLRADEVVFDEFERLAEETLTPEEEEAENDRRREMGDPPLPAAEYARLEGLDNDAEPKDCPECYAEPAVRGGRGFLCRGRSML
jgi:hypothetical protein